MSNCPECDSKIVEGEPFCAVCGISLAVATPPELPVEDALESTIMMSPQELSEFAAGQAEKKTDSEPAVEGASATRDNIIAKSTSDYGRFEKTHGSSTAAEVGRSDTDVAVDTDRPPTLGRIDESLLQPDVVAPETPAFVASTATPKAENVGTPDFNPRSSDPRSPIEVDKVEDREIDGPVTSAAQQPDASGSVSASDPFGNIQAVDTGIAKPDFALPDPLAGSSQPIYDSVRIVGTDIPESQDQVSTRIPSFTEPRSPNLADPVVSSPGSEIPIHEPERSQTSPNFTGSGNAGRGTSKLKPLSEGVILNSRYEIIRKIGGGGMGAVYLASDNNLGGVLRAVKEMVQAHIEEDQQEKAINDFKRESMILSSLDHPSIPTIFDYFYDQAEGRFYLVMKYISGGDLSSRLRSATEGKIDEAVVVEWALQIIDVLNYLHSQPSTIVYRDLKPSNIMIDGNSGRVMLIDFGIARSISQKEEKGVTAVGTMGYAPPELFSGNVEPRSDIYSLGSTMFHLLTGADPQSNPLLIFDFQKNPRPRQINPRLSDQIEQILMRSVEYNASSRFSSASEMRQILDQHLANLRSGNVTFGVTEAPMAVSLENQIVFCGFCGQRIIATDMFCAFCGSKQPIAQQGVHSGVYTRAGTTARLQIEGTSELNMPTFSLQKEENLLGRRDPMSNIFPEVDLSKFDPQTKISRRHARIWRDGISFLVEDLGSSNGTILAVAGIDPMRLVPHQPHKLASGDRIRLGDTTLHFVVE